MYVRLGFSLSHIVCEIIGLFELLIIVKAFLSWFSSPWSNVMVILDRVTEPVVRPVRNVTNRLIGTWRLDISPAVTVILLDLLKQLIYKLL